MAAWCRNARAVSMAPPGVTRGRARARDAGRPGTFVAAGARATVAVMATRSRRRRSARRHHNPSRDDVEVFYAGPPSRSGGFAPVRSRGVLDRIKADPGAGLAAGAIGFFAGWLLAKAFAPAPQIVVASPTPS